MALPSRKKSHDDKRGTRTRNERPQKLAIFLLSYGLPGLNYPGSWAFLVLRRCQAIIGTRKALVFSYASSTFTATVEACRAASGLPLAGIIDDPDVQQLLDPDVQQLLDLAHGQPLAFEPDVQTLADEQQVHFAAGDDDVYTPPVVIWGWLTQIFSPAKSCVAAVARIIVLRVAMGLTPCSAHDGAYCKARSKLPESFLKCLTVRMGAQVERQASEDWRWKGRRVLLADGLECSLPDTPANQAQYPQSRSQKPGLGFPPIRLVVLLAFATAGVIDCAMGPRQGKETGETALFRQLLAIGAGDVVVADRYYCTYWHIALLKGRGADSVLRLHARRKYDFRKGKRLSVGDHQVTWQKPAKPEWMDQDTYQSLPETLSMREVKVTVRCPGFRVREMVVATTLLDATKYTKQELADLYHKRWHVELDIRSIKQTLKMDILSCKSPEMVRKEIWIHLLGYNQIRKMMATAALAGQTLPRQLSFAAAVQTLEAFRLLLALSDAKQRAQFVSIIVVALSSHEVGNRPGRREPRRVKRRPKPYGRLMVPRAQARAQLLNTK
jgi:hypothetical protein